MTLVCMELVLTAEYHWKPSEKQQSFAWIETKEATYF